MSSDPAPNTDLDSVGFHTGVSQTGRDEAQLTARLCSTTRRPRRGLRNRVARRVVSAVVLFFALLCMGGVYSLFAQSSSANANDTADVSIGRQLYAISCITCHGANLDGVKDQGPSLQGVGGAATYFYVATGRMPLAQQGAEAPRHDQYYTEKEIEGLVAYVQSAGGGEPVPSGSLRDDAHVAEGGELFRLNCASCHNFAAKGAVLSAGKVVPSMNESTDKEIVTAMLTGPGNMPVFSQNQLTPEQKKQIVSYIQTLKTSRDPGGHGLARVGPVTEGLVIWVVGIGALMAVILWIGAKS